MVTVFSREAIKDQEIDRLGCDLGVALTRAEAAEAQLAKAREARKNLRQIVMDCFSRMSAAGESREMCARWICEEFDRAALAQEGK